MILRRLLRLTTFSLAICSARLLPAEEPTAPQAPPAANPAPKRKPASDPFTKTPGAAPNAAEWKQPSANVVLEYDWIDAPRDEFATLVREKGLAPDAGAVRTELQAWIAQGRAKLVQLDFLLTPLGKRTFQTSVAEIRYTTNPSALLSPTQYVDGKDLGFEARNCDWTTEVEPLLDPDGRSLVLNSVASTTSFAGELGSMLPPPGAGRDGLFVPSLKNRKITSSISLTPDTWRLFWAGVAPAEAAPTANTRALFVRAKLVPVSPAQKPGAGDDIVLDTEWIDVPLSALNEWVFPRSLTEVVTNLPAQVQSWLAAGKASRRAIDITPTKFGQRAVGEAIDEHVYPTTFRILQDGNFAVSEFDKRNIGTVMEYEPIISPDHRTVHLNIEPQMTLRVGEQVFHRQQRGEQWVADVSQPIFFSTRLTMTVLVPINTSSLLGTFAVTAADFRFSEETKTIVLVHAHH